MRRLTVLYDARCGLCSWARRWARGQPAFVELVFLGGRLLRGPPRFPGLDRAGRARGADRRKRRRGRLPRADDAWIMCLYALEDFREWSLRLATPALRPMARQAFALVSRSRPLPLAMARPDARRRTRRHARPASRPWPAGWGSRGRTGENPFVGPASRPDCDPASSQPRPPTAVAIRPSRAGPTARRESCRPGAPLSGSSCR